MAGRSIPASSTVSGVVADRDKSDGLQTTALHCHICWKPPTDPVATSCGHVFCWPCVFPLVVDKRKRKPCPVCGTFLTRDMNILPLYGFAEPTEVRASSENVIPPRPNNPQMFIPRFARRRRREGSNSDHGSDLDTPVSTTTLLQQIEEETRRERARNERLEAKLKRDQWLYDRERMELARIERKLLRENYRMGLDNARLEEELALAAQSLPNGWSDLISDDEALLDDASAPSNASP